MAAVTTTDSVSSTLTVIEKYEALVQNSLEEESVYIRTKETLQDSFDSNPITEADREA